MFLGVFNLRPGALADLTAYIDYIDGVRHIYLPFMHVIKHGFSTVSPNFVISRVPEESYTDNNITFMG